MSDAAPVLGVILAGGMNERYGGVPKALETVAGVRIADRASKAMRAAAASAVLIANDPDTFSTLGLPMRPDIRPGFGVLGGILTAINWAEEERCRGELVAACDMPFLSAGLLMRLARGARPEEAVVPASDSRRGMEPLCAFYGVDCREAITAALERGDRRIISFFDDISLRVLAREEVRQFGDPRLLFLNVNTPHDRELAESAALQLEEEAE